MTWSMRSVSCETVSGFGAGAVTGGAGAGAALGVRFAVSCSRKSKKFVPDIVPQRNLYDEAHTRPLKRARRLRAQRLHEQPELQLVVLVRDLVLVERIDLDPLLGQHVVVGGEDRAGRTDVVPQAVAHDRAARDPRRQVDAVAVAQRA